MKKILSVFACTLLLCNIFLSCSNDDDSSQNSENTSYEKIDSVNIRTEKIKFDFSNAKALAKLESSSSFRAAINTDNIGDIVKILEDGSLANAITVEQNSFLSDIEAVYKSPLENSKDVFVVLKSTSSIGYDEKIKQSLSLGQLICIHEDGSISDILHVDDGEKYYSWTHITIKTDSVQFDYNGKIYFVSKSDGVDINGERAKGEMIYQYNSSTKELTLMVAAVENTTYTKLQIDKTGQWIFASGNRSSSFLRAIPIGNPNAFVNVYYSSTKGLAAEKWVYDDNSGTIYFIAQDGNDSGLFTATKSGGFKDKKLQRNYVGEGIDCELLDSFTARETLSFYDSVQTDGKFDAAKAVKTILDDGCIKNGGFDDYSKQDESGKRIREYKYFKLTSDMVDIRFDLYSSETGILRAMSLITKGKKNEEALQALLDTIIGRATLSCYSEPKPDRFKSKKAGDTQYYENNFLADILYVKDSDTLLKDSDAVLFSYTDSDGTVHEIKGKDVFVKNSSGYTENGFINITYSYAGNWVNFTFAFAPKFYKNNVLDSSALLKHLFSFCNVEGSKEFRLTAFKDDKTYGALYSDLTNEAALEWLASDAERMNLLGKMFRNDKGVVYVQQFYPSFMNFIQKCCFINGTDNNATSWNDDSITSIGYYDSSSCIIGNVSNLSANEKGVFGICTNTDYSIYMSSREDPYYYIIQIADSNGKILDLQNRLPLPNGKVVKSQTDTERLLLQYSLLNSSGGELGYHHIYAVDFDSGNVKNCFENVPNRNGLEVVTFNTAGDMLYYSAVRGTTVENGIVNIATGEYNPLSVNRKMVAVYTFK